MVLKIDFIQTLFNYIINHLLCSYHFYLNSNLFGYIIRYLWLQILIQRTSRMDIYDTFMVSFLLNQSMKDSARHLLLRCMNEIQFWNNMRVSK